MHVPNLSPLPFTAREGWSLIDAVAHPSGQHTVVLADGNVVRLLRIDAHGKVLKKSDFRDPRSDSALSTRLRRGAVQLRAIGEAVTMVLRTNAQAVMVCRLSFCVARGYRKLWSSLVTPGLHRA